MTLERVAEIGEVVGDEVYQFGHVGGVAGDDRGRIYVADRMGSFIRVYDRDGAFLRQIGREGAGPGEFLYPTDLFLDDAGRLWVRDFRRATVFAPRSSGAIPDSVVETRPFRGYTNWSSSARSRLIDGVYYYPDYTSIPGQPTRHFYFGYDTDGPTGDTVPVPDYPTLQAADEAHYMVDRGTGRMVYGLNRAPFEPGPSWELTVHGTIVGGAGESSIVETDPSGDTVAAVRVGPRRPVADGERRDSVRALRARLDSLPVPLKDVEGVSALVKDGVLPDSVPGFTSVHTSTTGDLWVRRWPPEGDPGTHFDVHAGSGELLGHVRVPRLLLDDPPPYIDGERIIGVVRDPETDVHGIVVYRLPGDAGGPDRDDAG